MKYTTPDYELEIVETEDILEESLLMADPNGDWTVVHDPEEKSAEVRVPSIDRLI